MLQIAIAIAIACLVALPNEKGHVAKDGTTTTTTIGGAAVNHHITTGFLKALSLCSLHLIHDKRLNYACSVALLSSLFMKLMVFDRLQTDL